MTTAIFDLDGTLADTIEDLADAVNYGLRILGFPEHDINSYKKFVGNGAMKLCFRALPDDKKTWQKSCIPFSSNTTAAIILTKPVCIMASQKF